MLGHDRHDVGVDREEATVDGHRAALALERLDGHLTLDEDAEQGVWPGRMPSSPEMDRARTNLASPSQTLRSAATISTLSELTFPPDRGGVLAV